MLRWLRWRDTGKHVPSQVDVIRGLRVSLMIVSRLWNQFQTTGYIIKSPVQVFQITWHLRKISMLDWMHGAIERGRLESSLRTSLLCMEQQFPGKLHTGQQTRAFTPSDLLCVPPSMDRIPFGKPFLYIRRAISCWDSVPWMLLGESPSGKTLGSLSYLQQYHLSNISSLQQLW